MSIAAPVQDAPRSRQRATTSASRTALRPIRASLHPGLASFSAKAAPMPLEAPVIATANPSIVVWRRGADSPFLTSASISDFSSLRLPRSANATLVCSPLSEGRQHVRWHADMSADCIHERGTTPYCFQLLRNRVEDPLDLAPVVTCRDEEAQ